MTGVYIALGSNLGDRLANLRAAVAALDERGVAVTARSAVWETPPVPAGRPPFLNAAVARAERQAALKAGLPPDREKTVLAEWKARS